MYCHNLTVQGLPRQVPVQSSEILGADSGAQYDCARPYTASGAGRDLEPHGQLLLSQAHSHSQSRFRPTIRLQPEHQGLATTYSKFQQKISHNRYQHVILSDGWDDNGIKCVY